MVALKEVMDYEFPELLVSFRKQYAVSVEDSEKIFEDLKRWLWLANDAPESSPVMLEGMWVIDEMWHLFITYTVNYAEFSNQMFGRFLHHVPVPQEERRAHKEGLRSGDEVVRLEVALAIAPWRAEVNRKLGADVENRWIREYPTSYPPAVRLSLAIQALTAQFIDSEHGAPLARKIVPGESDSDMTAQHIPRCDFMPNCGPGCSGICLGPVRPPRS